MCHDLDSAPPIPAISGAAVSHEDVVLEAADGTEFAAFAATPDEPGTVGIVVLPDVRGLYRFYEELALRFAERGMTAIAIDYFGRTLGVGKRENDWDYMTEVAKTTPEGIQQDVAAAVAWLREHGATDVFTVGFCFGGRNSWIASASGHGLAGAIGFYGGIQENPIQPAVFGYVPEMKAPVLALQAGADAKITAEDNAAFDEAMTAAGVEHEVVIFDGAPHSFFDRTQEEHAEASAEAWSRVLAFIEAHAGS